MGHRFLEIATSPAARAAQMAHGSRAAYARMEAGPPVNDRLGPREAEFIAARDSLYIASVTPDGWPYIQHRGGARGFLKVLDEGRLGFADRPGNKQYLTLGNIAGDDRVALFLMDYPHRRRLKLLGRMTVVDPAAAPDLAAALAGGDAGPAPERLLIISVEAFDWNCPKYITPRFTADELAGQLQPLVDRLTLLEAENAALRVAAGKETGS